MIASRFWVHRVVGWVVFSGLFALPVLSLALHALIRCGSAAAAEGDAPAIHGGAVRPARTAASVVQKATDELLELKRKLREVEAESAERTRTQTARLEELRGERQGVERSVQALTAEASRREKDIAARKEATARSQKESKRVTDEVRASLDPLRGYLDRLETHVTAGIPWRIEARKQAIAEARKLLDAQGTTAAAALGAIARLEEQEEALGRWVEPGVVEVEVRGEKRALPALRLGSLAVLYASEDGTVAGFARRGQGLEEGMLSDPAAAASAARGYLLAIDVLRRRVSPRLVELHVPSLAVGEEGSK